MENESNDAKTIPSSCLAALHRRQYNREYYHQHKTLVGCAHCGKVYSCRSGLVKHMRRSQKCMVIKLQKYIADMEGNSVCGIPEKELYAHIMSELETV